MALRRSASRPASRTGGDHRIERDVHHLGEPAPYPLARGRVPGRLAESDHAGKVVEHARDLVVVVAEMGADVAASRDQRVAEQVVLGDPDRRFDRGRHSAAGCGRDDRAPGDHRAADRGAQDGALERGALRGLARFTACAPIGPAATASRG